ncbi:MAG: YhbY family RNA-binding protein [Halobacteria archaeon]
MDINELRKEAQDLDVSVWVGKKGLENVVDELSGQLSSNKLVKVKFLRSARARKETEELAKTLADKTGSTLVEVRGNTAVFH